MFYVFLRVQFTVNNLWRQMVIEHKLPPKENRLKNGSFQTPILTCMINKDYVNESRKLFKQAL